MSILAEMHYVVVRYILCLWLWGSCAAIATYFCIWVCGIPWNSFI